MRYRGYLFLTPALLVLVLIGHVLFPWPIRAPRMLGTGSLSDACRHQVIGMPFGMLRSIPGWPNLILARAQQAGARVFVTDVDTEDQLAAISNMPIDGIQTNRIEVIGPLVADLAQHSTMSNSRRNGTPVVD